MSSSKAEVAPSMGALEWAMLLLLSALWGGSFFFNGVAVRELPTLTVVLARLALASLTLNLALRIVGVRAPRERRIWIAFFAMGALNNAIPFALIVWGQAQIGSGVASILNATTPLFTVLAAHLLTADEKLTGTKLLGVALGFAGVAAMIGGATVTGGEVGAGSVAASLAVLSAAVAYAFASIYGRRFRRLGVSPLAAAAGQVTASTLLLAPLTLLIDQPWALAAPSTPVIGALVAVGVLSTALAYVLYFQILTRSGAVNLMLVTFLVPVSAVVLGAAFLDERLEGRHMVGMALIALGLAAVDGRLARWLISRGR